MSSICQLSLAGVQGFEPSSSAACDPEAELQQVVGATTDPGHAPALEAPADHNLDVFLHGGEAGGNYRGIDIRASRAGPR